jgi:hypothetical protein
LSSPTASLPEEKGDNYPELSDRTPRAAFDARDKARPSGPKIKVGAGVRVRRDRIDRNGKVTPFTRPRGVTSISTTATIGRGLSATPTSIGRTCPIASPI